MKHNFFPDAMPVKFCDVVMTLKIQYLTCNAGYPGDLALVFLTSTKHTMKKYFESDYLPFQHHFTLPHQCSITSPTNLVVKSNTLNIINIGRLHSS
jgi:hypothetical protein